MKKNKINSRIFLFSALKFLQRSSLRIPSNAKQFEKGIVQLAQEGAIQVFRQKNIGMESFVVGVVGVLQLEVLDYRLKNEYSAQLLMDRLPYSVARWVYAGDAEAIRNMKGLDNGILVYDKLGRPVVLVSNEWNLNWLLGGILASISQKCHLKQEPSPTMERSRVCS